MRLLTIDPRIGLGWVILFASVMAVAQKPITLGAGLLLSALLLLMSPPLWSKGLRRLVMVNVALLPLWLFVPLQWDGDGLMAWSWSSAGFQLAARIALRASAIALAATAILDPWGPLGLLQALRGWHAPPTLERTVGISLRFFSFSRQEFDRLRSAMLARGYRPVASRAGYAALASALGALFLRNLDRSDRVMRAMNARTFGPAARTSLAPLTSRDWCWGAAGWGVIIAIVAVEFWA